MKKLVGSNKISDNKNCHCNMMKAIILTAVEIVLWMGFVCSFLVTLISYLVYLFDFGDLFIEPTIILVLFIAGLTILKEIEEKK
jgi:hypothetical protein